MITLETWRSRMSEDLRLRDYSPRTQEGYLLAARQFVDWVGREPETWTEDDVRGYFLYLREDKKLSPSSINVTLHALRFFVLHTLGHDWPVMELLRVHRPQKLPVVLSRKEVRAVLSVVRDPMRRMAFTTIYALGLRLGEALRLQTEHIDSDRLMVWVRSGKGAKDRAIAMPRPLLTRLRRYWKEERPKASSPATAGHLFISARTGEPVHPTTLQKTFIAARKEAALKKHASIHTLRHSYATHLLESGVSLRTIQKLLGHKAMKTTLLYMHVTHEADDKLQETLDRLMADLT
ncbi:MAG: tyrosine-type recombinase/integrase [bacterium]|nr:tyrosine-type recombinase/integrase [bacterium]